MRKTLQFVFVTLLFLGVSAQASDTVLIVVTSHDQMGNTGEPTGFWLSELTHPYFVIKEAGHDIVIASIKGGNAPIDPRSVDTTDQINQRFLNDPKLVKLVSNSRKLSNINPTSFSAVLFSGGHGAMWDFPGNADVNDVSKTIYESGGVVGAVCHGPAALSDIMLSNGEYLINGKQFAAFTNEEETMVELDKVVPFMLEDRLIKRGGKIVSAKPWQSNAVIDNRVVTGQNPQSAHRVGELIVEALKASDSDK